MGIENRNSQLTTDIWVVDGGRAEQMPDSLAVEEPLEIQLAEKGGARSLAVTLRTPGADEELAAGFLYAEGVVRERQDLRAISTSTTGPSAGSLVRVELRRELEPDLRSLERHFYTNSACGLCGKSGLEALLMTRTPELGAGPRVDPQLLPTLPRTLRKAQGIFQRTGGLHAAGLFDAHGQLLAVREDVGRHNAFDKVIGWAFLEDRLPLRESLMMVSGRASYELVQKALMAEIPILCAVSAPSSAAVAAARRYDLTLVGFLREDRFNIYSGAHRLGIGEED
jgi:FdhD protein